MDDFQEDEKVVGHFDTDSGGILITDMVWDIPQASQQRFSEDLDLSNVRIPIKAVLLDGKRRLILELDEAVSTLPPPQEVVKVVDKKEEVEE